MNNKKFYDTCSLLNIEKLAFKEPFIISSTSLLELENIKTSGTKDELTKYKAREIIRQLNDNEGKYKVIIADNDINNIIREFNLPITNDNIIIASAYRFNRDIESIIFYSDDLCAKIIAKNLFGLNVKSTKDNVIEEEYKGYKDLILTNEQMEYLYSHRNINIYNNEINEYLLIRDLNNEIKDRFRWDGKSYTNLKFKPFKSKILNEVKPLDEIQMFAFDSISNNEITMLYGKAGSGKTTIPLAYIMQGLESQKIKKCYIIYHYETLKKAKTLGFEAGSHETKLLNTGSIGNILSSKFADYKYITSMLGDKIEIIPTANIRGVEFGAEDAVFVTECQNIDPYTLKTIVQRCKTGCKQIYEGDMLEQSDINMSVSGMARMLDVFKNYHDFGCIKLKNNYRSETCEIADKM
jgi:PhoH-like ATPase